MFAKNVLAAARIGARGAARVGGLGTVLVADRPRYRITAVWQRNPVSGRLELGWQSAAGTREDREPDDVPGRRSRSPGRGMLVVGQDQRAASAFLAPGCRAA